VGERAGERAQASERAGVNTRVRVRTYTRVGIHTRANTRTNVWVWGLKFNPTNQLTCILTFFHDVSHGESGKPNKKLE